MNKILLAAILCGILSINVQAQCSLKKVGLQHRTTDAFEVVEGKVVSQFSFWDDNHHNIYTASKIQVFKELKGSTSQPFVEIITPGGTVGMQRDVVEPSLQLEVGDVGVFFIEPTNVPMNSTTFETSVQGRPAAGPQGFVEYHLDQGIAHDAFAEYTNPETQVLQFVQNQTGQVPNVLQSFDFSTEVSILAAIPKASSISSFAPTTVTAGTATVITIDGSDFGVSAGTVRFSNADDGGATFVDGLATEIISWTPTQIIVEVYQEAGTGPIQVVGNGTATSAQTLTVNYAQLNAEFDPGSGIESYQTRHINRNGNGGYIWQMHTDFDAGPGNAAFVRSLDSWRCNTGIYWEIGATTTTDQVANDDINIVRHDNGGELPNGVLGRCTSRWSGCGGATIEWYVEELDIVYDDGTNWNYTTSAPGITEYDFESVSVHELGHGHQLGHVINTNDVMHYAISNGEQQRTPSANNLAGAGDVQSRSTGGSVCGETVMSSYSCGAAPVADFSASSTNICAGASVNFTDLSTNTPTGWSWTINGGTPSSSSVQNPSGVVFNTPGSYTIVLTATNASGSDDETKVGYITVNENPNVSSTGQTGETCVGNDGTATVTPSGGSGSFNILWDVAAGSQTTPTATSLAAGTYGVTVTDAVSSCQSSTNVAVNDDCVTSTTQVTAADCGTTLTSGVEHFHCDPVANAINYQWRFVSTVDGYTTEKYRNNSQTNMWSNAVGGLVNGVTYDVQVRASVIGSGWGSYGSVCQVTMPGAPIPTTQLAAGYCPYNAGAVTEWIFCDPVANATDYEFRFTPSGGGTPVSGLRGSNQPSYYLANPAVGLQNGTTYDVDVRAIVGTTTGTYSTVCQVTIPAGGTQVRAVDCGITVASQSQWFYCDPVAGATNYEWQFTDGPTVLTRQRGSSHTGMFFAAVSGVQPSTTYDVQVRAFVGGAWETFGTVCQITSSASFTGGGSSSSIAASTFDMDQMQTQRSLQVYPNPNNGQEVWLSMVDLPDTGNGADVIIYDMYGKQVYAEHTEWQNGVMNEIVAFDTPLAPGFYLVSLVVEDERHTVKMVVK